MIEVVTCQNCGKRTEFRDVYSVCGKCRHPLSAIPEDAGHEDEDSSIVTADKLYEPVEENPRDYDDFGGTNTE